MKSLPGRSAMWPLILISMAIRVFLGMVFVPVKASNAVWMCPLVGLILTLPLLWSVQHTAKLGNASAWENIRNLGCRPLCNGVGIIFAILLIFDAAVVLRLMANTARVVALSAIPAGFLTLPLVLLEFFVLLMDSDSAGNSAKIWLLFLPLLFAVLFIVQIRSFETEWLTPVLGGGLQAVVHGSVYSAGWIAIIALLWLVCLPDRGKSRLIAISIGSALAASVLLAALSMLCPTLVDTEFTRSERLQLLLSNGRVELALQSILILLWYADLLYLLCAEALAGASFIRHTFKRLPGWLISAIVSIITGIFASTALTGDPVVNRVSPYLFICIAGLLFMLMVIAYFRKGGKRACTSTRS